MRDRFKELCRKCNAISDVGSIYAYLVKRYSEPHRFYHNLQHIENCLIQMDMISGNEIDPIVIEFALWFHDAVYDPKANDNEEQSALLAKSVCEDAELPDSFSKKVQKLILLTKHTLEPSDFMQKVIIDVDLSILGSDPQTYDNFEMAIRKEYSHVNDRDFITGRSSILNGFLNRKRIFYTDFFFSKYELPARSNLTQTVQKLKKEKFNKSNRLCASCAGEKARKLKTNCKSAAKEYIMVGIVTTAYNSKNAAIVKSLLRTFGIR